MNKIESRDEKLKNYLKEQIRLNLLAVGRKLVVEKGPEFLTARKLSEASHTSVGTIYNQFATMENFINAENIQTLDELYAAMRVIVTEANPYANLNRYVDVFSHFVINNPYLWSLVFKAHLNNEKPIFSFEYLRKTRKIEKLLEIQLQIMFGSLGHAERRLAAQVLEMSLFAVSGFLAAKGWDNLRQVNKYNICKLLLNTYLAGLDGLKRVK